MECASDPGISAHRPRPALTRALLHSPQGCVGTRHGAEEAQEGGWKATVSRSAWVQHRQVQFGT